MASLRDIKNQARRDLHAHAQIPALYVSAENADPRLVTVRLHTKFNAIGGLTGDKDWAERREITPRIIVMRDQIERPRKGAIISVAAGEAYRIDRTDPPDGITITCFVVPLTAVETKDLPFPLPGETAMPPTSGTGGIPNSQTSDGVVTIYVPEVTGTWVLNHQLNKEPMVTLYDSSNLMFEADYDYTDRNTVTVYVTPAASGRAVLK